VQYGSSGTDTTQLFWEKRLKGCACGRQRRECQFLEKKSEWPSKFDIVSCLLFMESSCSKKNMNKATRLLLYGPDPKAWITIALVEIPSMNFFFPRLLKYCGGYNIPLHILDNFDTVPGHSTGLGYFRPWNITFALQPMNHATMKALKPIM
jgi:hypothetical protein